MEPVISFPPARTSPAQAGCKGAGFFRPDNPLNSRSTLRQYLRTRRRELPPAARKAAARAAARIADTSPLLRRCRTLAVYLADDGELDPAPLVRRARRRHKTCLLPMLVPLNRRLVFAKWRPGERLARNRYGIGEPRNGMRQRHRLRGIDVVLVPLVAFDAQGHRLGRGAGWYDRTFASHALRPRWRKPRLVGYAYAFQQVDRIETRPWDIPLDAIVTDRGMLMP